jgi:hypothetical protein
MVEPVDDQSILNDIQQLASEEHRLYAQGSLSNQDRERLNKIKIELDQCWDFLRQREALRAAGQDPSQAHVRPPKVVENYEQ